MAQLIVIPAVIVIVSISVIATLGLLVRSPDTVSDLLVRLQLPSGMGRTAVGLQDPRYLERCRAAQDLAMRIPHLKDAQERQRVNAALIATLQTPVDPGQGIELHTYLLLAIGMLGEPSGLEVLLTRLESEEIRIVEGAVGGILAWPDVEAARRAVPDLLRVLDSDSSIVRAEAAAALGKLAQPQDTQAIESLARAMQVTGTQGREVAWNAGVALAKLGDVRGTRLLTNVLLNREALAQLPATEAAPHATQTMSRAVQDRIMIQTLANVMSSDGPTTTFHMTDAGLWDKIGELAEKDESREVQKVARALLSKRNTRPIIHR
jgi:hypothetical protein